MCIIHARFVCNDTLNALIALAYFPSQYAALVHSLVSYHLAHWNWTLFGLTRKCLQMHEASQISGETFQRLLNQIFSLKKFQQRKI